MRKLFFLSVVALLSVSLFAQQKKMVEFDKSIHDFGKIVEGQGNGGKVTAVFKFTNIGTTPIFIESARASCGCTTPSVDSSKPIAPGGTGEIPVTYNTIGRPGTFNKSVTVTFKNASGETTSENICIRGEVTPQNQVTLDDDSKNVSIQKEASINKVDIKKNEADSKSNNNSKADVKVKKEKKAKNKDKSQNKK